MRIQVETLHANVAGGLVQREIMVDVESAAAGRALLLFTGEGGSGKTASLHQWAKDLAAHENGPLVGSVMTRTLSRAWLPELVQRWRGIPEASSEPAEKSIRRLQIAGNLTCRHRYFTCRWTVSMKNLATSS